MARIVVTGGAGFLGSHLCETLLARGDSVVCVDNLATSDGTNVDGFRDHERFELLEVDICQPFVVEGAIDAVANLASPASPPEYQRMPLETLAVGSYGTENAIAVAERAGARFVTASTSEIYGTALEHPQREEYWGNVDPIGPRSMYDESKRYSEALTTAYAEARGLDAGIVRIFNTYGPRLRASDGRVISNLVVQAIKGEPLTIYGDGSQTRSFCYVDDLVAGLIRMIDKVGERGPVNLGNPVEVTISELATRILACTGSSSQVVHMAPAAGDPVRRCPDITRAKERLDWEPTLTLDEGLALTAAWYREHLSASR
ncbi:MAG TPA: NAD-dependent epimerase/dehydratase family protein [Acidimicrobiales bacterium]|nr:NAD-dependent epimerase/dehydratase family protein [Acidimicrobiales bacterium]